MSSKSSKPLILSVDEEEDMRALISRWLSDAGYDVISVDRVSKISEALKGTIPDLIFLDVMMPGTDGYTFCAKLQQTPDLADIPIIFLTALDEKRDKAKAFASGWEEDVAWS